MDDQQLLRYSRQIMLPQVDVAGQRKLLESHVVIIGAGGLGSPAAMYLAGAGVGHLTVVDHDRVDLSNLQRQILHSNSDLGIPKVDSARARLNALNPDVTVTPVDAHAEGEQLRRLAEQADVVVDASDNFATRFAVNAACVRAGPRGQPLLPLPVPRGRGAGPDLHRQRRAGTGSRRYRKPAGA
jgi:molybdopterin/thiamine biosynthesis adenylyltransferase